MDSEYLDYNPQENIKLVEQFMRKLTMRFPLGPLQLQKVEKEAKFCGKKDKFGHRIEDPFGYFDYL